MAGSRSRTPMGMTPLETAILTPGPLGHNDYASPDNYSSPGDTPGPVGINDLAARSVNAPLERYHSGSGLTAKGQQRYGLRDEIDVPLGVNSGLRAPNEEFMLSLFGKPRKHFSDDCLPVTNKDLLPKIDFMNFGIFEEQGLCPALNSLREILREIKISFPEVYSKLGSAGMLCCRFQRRSTRISNHSWGTAIDLKLCGKVDKPGNGKVQYGLSLIAPIFNRHGWVWGATFRVEDAMHFEVSKKKLLEWQRDGHLGPTPPSQDNLRAGSSGPDVVLLQHALNRQGADLAVNGLFDAMTKTEVQKFQGRSGLNPDGIVGPLTRRALGISGDADAERKL